MIKRLQPWVRETVIRTLATIAIVVFGMVFNEANESFIFVFNVFLVSGNLLVIGQGLKSGIYEPI